MFITLLNMVYNVTYWLSWLSFIANKRSMFVLSLFNNMYWLIVGLVFNWPANIVITLYFVPVNIWGYYNYGKVYKTPKVQIMAMLVPMVIAIGLSMYLGQTGVGTLNTINCAIYCVTVTLRAIKQYANTARWLYVINQALWVVNIILCPALIACLPRVLFTGIVTLIAAIVYKTNPQWQAQLQAKITAKAHTLIKACWHWLTNNNSSVVIN